MPIIDNFKDRTYKFGKRKWKNTKKNCTFGKGLQRERNLISESLAQNPFAGKYQ